jgi:murein L,D-transpeptidase YafK
MTFKRIPGVIFFTVLVAVVVYYFYPYRRIPSNVTIDKLVVIKSKRQLLAFSEGRVIKTFTIALGDVPTGDKQFEGDRKTPEGRYYINAKNPISGYHRNLGISYPDRDDIREGKRLGKPTGGDVKIHGLKNGLGYIGRFQRWMDWTNGCIALTDEEVADLYDHTPVGTPIIIKP